MPNPLFIGDAADLVDVSIQRIVLKGSDLQTNHYEQYMNVERGVTDYYLKDSGMSGLSYASRMLENAVVTAQSPVQTYDKTYTQVQYGVLMSVTKMMWFFGIKKRELTKIVNETVKANNDLRELRCAERLDYSFATSYNAEDESGNYTVSTVGGDSVAFASASHTREDGGTNWNNIVTDGSTTNMDKFNVHIKSFLNILGNLRAYCVV